MLLGHILVIVGFAGLVVYFFARESVFDKARWIAKSYGVRTRNLYIDNEAVCKYRDDQFLITITYHEWFERVMNIAICYNDEEVYCCLSNDKFGSSHTIRVCKKGVWRKELDKLYTKLLEEESKNE